MSDYEKIEEEYNNAKLKGCKTCYLSTNGRPNPRKDDAYTGSCRACRRLSNWEWEGSVFSLACRISQNRQFLNMTEDWKLLPLLDREPGGKVIAKHVRPAHTRWRPGPVHKDIRRSARRSRRVFKQYLKTGSLRLLKAAERKITSWGFD